MQSSLQNGRRKPRPWTAQDQLTAEVAAACGVMLKDIALTLDRNKDLIRSKINLTVAAAQAKSQDKYKKLHKEKIKQARKQYYKANAEALRERCRAWHAANKERVLARKKRYRIANLVKELNRCRKWHAANASSISSKKRMQRRTQSERIRERDRIWRERNPASVREARKRYAQRHREKVNEFTRRRKARRRAGRVASFAPLTSKQKEQVFAVWRNCCAYCGSAEKLSVDHVLPLIRGGLDEVSNILPACRFCNTSKRDHHVESWYRQQSWFTEARWRKIQRHCPASVSGQLAIRI
jgi:hypothetical protein